MERIANFRPQSTFNKIGSMCFCVFRKKHKNTKTHRLSGAIIMLKKRQRNILSMCFCVFRRKKHKKTKTHWLSGAILLLGRRKKMGHCVFVFSGKKHKNTKKHRLSGAILMLKKTKKHLVNVFLCFSEEKNTKTQKHIGCLMHALWEETTKSHRLMHFLRIVSWRISYNTLSCFFLT